MLVDRLSLADLLGALTSALRSGTRRTILNANAYAVTLADTNPAFAAALAKADVVFCDGFSVYLASRLFGAPIEERLTYADITDELARTTHSCGASLFLLGAKDGVAATASRKLQAAIPGLEVHHHHGYFPKDAESSREVIDIINRSGAQVLFVGFGMPLQELWITEHRAELKPLVVFSVGAAIDYAAGTVPRGPRWMTQYGFEWLARLALEPRRLWRRYLLGLPEFGVLMARQWMGMRFHQMGAENQ
ncbi:MAG TPA: WecB/TagA/CpsF family glycosyltransferase [Gemmatimonadaceae bacterium]|nr:WecB/TagA/CpsF family glycosyltransferase [Gemmatimonadaceae bacterium]